MYDHDMDLGRTRGFRMPFRIAVSAMALLVALAVAVAGAGERRGAEARAGLDIADAAAHSWSSDAFLVYVENDEEVDENGTAARWGYLFYAPSLQQCRGYSVKSGKIVTAESLPVKFEAPPVHVSWIDSGRALAAAEQDAGRAFRRDHQGRLSTMLLMRGAFSDKDPDPTTWTLVYTSPSAPSLFVVVDAAAGKVRRTWRG